MLYLAIIQISKEMCQDFLLSMRKYWVGRVTDEKRQTNAGDVGLLCGPAKFDPCYPCLLS